MVWCDVTSTLDDVTDSVRGVSVSDGVFGHQRFISSQSGDTRQTHSTVWSVSGECHHTVSDIDVRRLFTGDDVRWVSQALDVDVCQSLM